MAEWIRSAATTWSAATIPAASSGTARRILRIDPAGLDTAQVSQHSSIEVAKDYQRWGFRRSDLVTAQRLGILPPAQSESESPDGLERGCWTFPVVDRGICRGHPVNLEDESGAPALFI